MPRAVAVGLPEPALQISASPRGYQSHFSHAGERIWPETNCYLDLWIENTPRSWAGSGARIRLCSFPPTTMASNGHSLSNSREDLRRLYGLEVTEEIVWVAATGNGRIRSVARRIKYS